MAAKRIELTVEEKAKRYDTWREKQNAYKRKLRKNKRDQKDNNFLKYFKDKYES